MERKRAPLAPPARQTTPQEVLPFRPGQIIGTVPLTAIKGTDELTDQERTLLQRGGYQEGDPLPDLSNTAAGLRLRKQVEEVVREAEDVRLSPPATASTLPLKQPRDIHTLAPHEREKALREFKELDELSGRIKQAREEASAHEEIPDHMAAIPGYLEAMAVTQQPPTVELVDDIGMTDARPRLRMKQQPAPQPPPEAKTGADISDLRVVCPRCNHDLNGELYTPTLEDKVSYMALLMGDQNRFRRKVSLFDGRIVVTFRSLLTAEEQLAMAQTDEDAKNGKISNLVFYAATLEDYKMVMCIESVQRKGKPPFMVAPITAYEFDDKQNRTALPEFRTWLDDEVLTAASIRRAVSRSYFEFSQILQYIEAHAPDSDFFAGIG